MAWAATGDVWEGKEMSETKKLPERLTRQLAAKGVDDAKDVAYALLTKRGHMKGGELTPAGKKREAMGAEGRAKDRAAKRSGGAPSDYTYDAKTNAVKKK